MGVGDLRGIKERQMKRNIVNARLENKGRSPKLCEIGEEDRKERVKMMEKKEYQGKLERLEKIFTYVKKAKDQNR